MLLDERQGGKVAAQSAQNATILRATAQAAQLWFS
jgi:hypothetical protein